MGNQPIMSVKASVSQQFRNLDSRFSQDVSTLSNSIKDLKVKAGLSPSSGGGQPNVTSVLDGEKVGDPRLAMKAKDLRGMTERRFAEVIEGWRKQNDALQQELDMYTNQQRISQERVQKRNTEIKNLRNENEKLTSLLRKCEERINQLFDVKEREEKEKKRANKLADQLFDHKKMIGDLQEQLKEAEKLLATTKHERNNLLVENHALKKGNADLRRDLVAAERDTQETKIELEMIEEMVHSIDNITPGGRQSESRANKMRISSSCLSPVPEVAPREAPSAMTALNTLKQNHESGMNSITSELAALKEREMVDKDEIKRLENALHELTG